MLLVLFLFFDCYFAPGRMRSITVSVFVCLSVCPSARISQKSHVQILCKFLYMLPMAVDRSYILPV